MPKTILLTRPEPHAASYADELGVQFADQITCVTSPLLEIRPTDAAPSFVGAQAILFTSANGVRTLSKMALNKPTIPCMCVGDKTAIEARSLGCDAFSANGGADDLVHLATSVLSPKNGPILYIRGKIATGDIAEKLTQQGFKVVEHIIYEQVPLSLSADAKSLFAAGKINILPMFSPFTAKLLIAEMRENPDWALDEIDVICLSKNVQLQTEGLSFRSMTVVDTPTADAMTTAIAALLRR